MAGGTSDLDRKANRVKASLSGAPLAAVPESGYLMDYVNYACTVSMAPLEFHLAGGLAQMSALLGNRVTFSLGPEWYPAHLWLVLLGRAGTKKSSAISLATRMLDEATEGKLRLPQQTTPEALWQTLGARPSGYIQLSEFLSFLERTKREYMGGIREDLCEIFDSPPHMHRKIKAGSTHVRHPSLTILAAAVTSSLSEWVRHRDLEGGFMSRFLFVPQVSEVSYIGMRENSDLDRRDLLVDTLRSRAKLIPGLQEQARRLIFTEEPRKIWEEYDQLQVSRHVPDEIAGFSNRLGLYTAKLSLCYALASGRLEPKAEDVTHARAFAEFTRRQVEHLTEEEFAGSKNGSEIVRIRSMIRNFAGEEGWADQRDVLRRSRLLGRDLERIVGTLEETGEVEKRVLKPEGGGRPRQQIRVARGS